MYHLIEFINPIMTDLEVSSRQRLERLRVRRGERLTAQVKPYVVEGPDGPMEVADLFFADGTTARRIPFDWFRFTTDE